MSRPSLPSQGPVTPEPVTGEPVTWGPLTLEPRTLEPRTLEPRTLEPRTLEPRTLEPLALDWEPQPLAREAARLASPARRRPVSTTGTRHGFRRSAPGGQSAGGLLPSSGRVSGRRVPLCNCWVRRPLTASGSTRPT
jgi:hypothetical protein